MYWFIGFLVLFMIGGMTGILGEWGPESADNRYEGTMTARQALAKSKNGASVRIGTEAGLDDVLKLCRTAGGPDVRKGRGKSCFLPCPMSLFIA